MGRRKKRRGWPWYAGSAPQSAYDGLFLGADGVGIDGGGRELGVTQPFLDHIERDAVRRQPQRRQSKQIRMMACDLKSEISQSLPTTTLTAIPNLMLYAIHGWRSLRFIYDEFYMYVLTLHANTTRLVTFTRPPNTAKTSKPYAAGRSTSWDILTTEDGPGAAHGW